MMDSYFKAAVCDLDKLLDDFEQNTDELESCRAVVCTPDVSHHSFSSELLYFQPENHAPKIQDGIHAAVSTSKASLEVLNISLNEKNVTGLDLLSTVDGGMSDEIQPSNIGRGGEPVCDLLSDTGNSMHTTVSPVNDQELQPDDFPLCKNNFPSLDLSCKPAVVCAPSSSYNGSSSSREPEIGGKISQDELHIEVRELGLLDLKTNGHVHFKPSEPCWNESKTACLKEEQLINNTCPTERLSSSNANDNDISVTLLCEPVEPAAHPIEETCVERNNTKMISNEEVNLEVVLLEEQKLSDSFKDGTRFRSAECEPSEFLHIEGGGTDKVEDLEVGEQLDGSEIKTSASAPRDISSVPRTSEEEVHSSLSCLPLAVSLCRSLVATEDKDSIMVPDEDNSVVHNDVSVRAAIVNSVTSDCVSYGATEHCRGEEKEEDQALNKVGHTVSEKKVDIQLGTNNNSEKVDTVALPHPQVITATGIPGAEIKPVNNVIYRVNEDNCNEVASINTASISQDLKSHDDMLMCDILISDAELDAFLNEQTPVYNSNAFEEGFPVLDANLPGLLYIEDFTDMEQNAQRQSEATVDKTVCSSDEASGLIDVECELQERLVEPHGAEKDEPCIRRDALKHNCETPEVQIAGEKNMMVHGGARPKQLFDRSPKLICDAESSKPTPPSTVVAGTENQLVNCGHAMTAPTDRETISDANDNLNSSGIERQNAEESLGSVDTEHTSVGAEVAAIGQKQPPWVPDSKAPNCMNCQMKFTFTKRRHHCRACGKVFCATCCNQKCKLQYMEKEARVCVICHNSISKGPKEQKRVWFADGVLPNGELADTTKLSSGGKRSSQDHSPIASPTTGTFAASGDHANDETNSETEKLHSPPSASDFTVTGVSDYRMLCGIEKCVGKDISLLPDDEEGLPPLLLATAEKGGGAMMEERPCHKQLLSLLEEGGPNPLTFILNANLLVNVKLISYSSEKCWFFSTNGLHGLGQAEIIILLLCLPQEDTLPKDIFKLFLSIYKDALKGKHINNLENVTFNESFLGSKDHGGFLFITPTFQNLHELPLPNTPFLCGILIQKMEVPWAKVFPIRVMLRLGAEYGVYPSPLVSIRNRKPLYGEVGHTIMNLLADLRNYQYTLPNIDGLVIHMEMGTSCIKIPLKRYNEVLKVINSSNEHVISIGASFSSEADSHLVCVQNDDGVYQTQANSATGQPRKVTGAGFVIFNGALKASSGFLAKSSIVEDGLMVQITPETMEALRQALREKKDFRIACGKLDAGELREDVNICWVESEDKTNKGVTSPIDGQSLEGILSDKIIQESDFETNDKLVKCTEVYYLLRNHDLATTTTYYQFAKEIATACSAALCENLRTLKENGMNKIALRISMDIDMVEYQAGAWGHLLPQRYLNDLDAALIPVIHGRTSDSSTLPLVMELMFFLIENLF